MDLKKYAKYVMDRYEQILTHAPSEKTRAVYEDRLAEEVRKTFAVFVVLTVNEKNRDATIDHARFTSIPLPAVGLRGTGFYEGFTPFGYVSLLDTVNSPEGTATYI